MVRGGKDVQVVEKVRDAAIEGFTAEEIQLGSSRGSGERCAGADGGRCVEDGFGDFEELRLLRRGKC